MLIMDPNSNPMVEPVNMCLTRHVLFREYSLEASKGSFVESFHININKNVNERRLRNKYAEREFRSI